MRILVRRFHLWLGLSLGLLFALLGLSGSVLVFYTAIDTALHPAVAAERGGPAAGEPFTVWDRALATGRAYRPAAGGRWTFEVTGERGAIPARYYPATTHHGEREMVWFSADGTRIVRAEPWGGYAMSFVYQLHMQLLAGEAGREVVGWAGVAMLLLLLSGVCAWWPRGSWRKALAFKRDAAAIRRLRDLHKLAGLWSVLPLIVLVATGVLLALPDLTQRLLAPAPLPAPRSAGAPAPPLALSRILVTARRALPDGRLVFFDVPNARDLPVRFRFQVPGDPHRRFPGSYVFVDRASGRVLAIHDVRRGGTGTTIVSWVRTLHDGTALGTASRILAVFAGLVPAMLAATGILHWLRRRRAARARS